MKRENLVLIGMRATGKTTIGRGIAKRLKMNFFDIDSEIEKNENLTIAEIVKKKGWQEFRKIENNFCKKISEYKKSVISTGGGVILNEENMKYLKNKSYIIYLNSSVKDIVNRIENSKNTHRPSLTGKSITEEIDEIFRERESLYKKYCDREFTVHGNYNNKDESIKICLNEIVNFLLDEDILNIRNFLQ